MSSKPTIVLDRVLRVMQPLVRLLVRNGVSYPALAAALKRSFLDAARAELDERAMPATDSALTLLTGVHRRDVRTLTRSAPASVAPPPRSLASEVIGRWLSDPTYLDGKGAPRTLPRDGSGLPGSFDALVAALSSDVRPRAVLDEMLRLAVATEDDAGVHLVGSGFTPEGGFEELAAMFADNLHDHAAAAAGNLHGASHFLEQSVFVDEISAESAQRMQKVSVQAWKLALKPVMREAQARFDRDAASAKPADRQHRARFGVYFYSEKTKD
jgi:Family of unknown function (DUF6502)